MQLALQILGILFMITIIFVAIWGIILANQAYNQLRYQNYLLEKITQNIYMLTCKMGIKGDSKVSLEDTKEENPLGDKNLK